MVDQFAIITFRNTGPIKTWSDMRAANVHNARTKPLDHAVAGAPAPEHLIGSGDLVADVKSCLCDAGLDPSRLRKNGVIAYEAIMSASPAFFDAGDASERERRLRAWTAAQVDFAKRRWGSLRVASMVLHLDEKTPHVHLVVVPIEMKSDGRRRDGGRAHAGLAGRMISGPGRFDQLQDDYAEAMAGFGLVRGVAGSGRKHEPVPVYLARMAAKEGALDASIAAISEDRAASAAERARAAAARAEVECHGREVAARAEQAEREDAARRRQLHQEREALQLAVDDERRRLRRRADEIALAEQELAAGEADLASRQASFARFRDELVATREKLAPIVVSAKEFVRAAAGMRVEDIVPAARPVVVAARQTLEACRPAPAPASFLHTQRQAPIAAGMAR